MFKILFFCTFVVIISGKPYPNEGVVPVSSVNDPKEEAGPVELPVEQLIRTDESQFENEELVKEYLKAVEDGQIDGDNVALKPLWLIAMRRRTTTTTTLPPPGAGGSGSAGGSSTAAPGGSSSVAPGGSSSVAPGGSSSVAPGGSSSAAPGGSSSVAPSGS